MLGYDPKAEGGFFFEDYNIAYYSALSTIQSNQNNCV